MPEEILISADRADDEWKYSIEPVERYYEPNRQNVTTNKENKHQPSADHLNNQSAVHSISSNVYALSTEFSKPFAYTSWSWANKDGCEKNLTLFRTLNRHQNILNPKKFFHPFYTQNDRRGPGFLYKFQMFADNGSDILLSIPESASFLKWWSSRNVNRGLKILNDDPLHINFVRESNLKVCPCYLEVQLSDLHLKKLLLSYQFMVNCPAILNITMHLHERVHKTNDSGRNIIKTRNSETDYSKFNKFGLHISDGTNVNAYNLFGVVVNQIYLKEIHDNLKFKHENYFMSNVVYLCSLIIAGSVIILSCYLSLKINTKLQQQTLLSSINDEQLMANQPSSFSSNCPSDIKRYSDQGIKKRLAKTKNSKDCAIVIFILYYLFIFIRVFIILAITSSFGIYAFYHHIRLEIYKLSLNTREIFLFTQSINQLIRDYYLMTVVDISYSMSINWKNIFSNIKCHEKPYVKIHESRNQNKKTCKCSSSGEMYTNQITFENPDFLFHLYNSSKENVEEITSHMYALHDYELKRQLIDFSLFRNKLKNNGWLNMHKNIDSYFGSNKINNTFKSGDNKKQYQETKIKNSESLHQLGIYIAEHLFATSKSRFFQRFIVNNKSLEFLLRLEMSKVETNCYNPDVHTHSNMEILTTYDFNSLSFFQVKRYDDFNRNVKRTPPENSNKPCEAETKSYFEFFKPAFIFYILALLDILLIYYGFCKLSSLFNGYSFCGKSVPYLKIETTNQPKIIVTSLEQNFRNHNKSLNNVTTSFQIQEDILGHFRCYSDKMPLFECNGLYSHGQDCHNSYCYKHSLVNILKFKWYSDIVQRSHCSILPNLVVLALVFIFFLFIPLWFTSFLKYRLNSYAFGVDYERQMSTILMNGEIQNILNFDSEIYVHTNVELMKKLSTWNRAHVQELNILKNYTMFNESADGNQTDYLATTSINSLNQPMVAYDEDRITIFCAILFRAGLTHLDEKFDADESDFKNATKIKLEAIINSIESVSSKCLYFTSVVIIFICAIVISDYVIMKPGSKDHIKNHIKVWDHKRGINNKTPGSDHVDNDTRLTTLPPLHMSKTTVTKPQLNKTALRLLNNNVERMKTKSTRSNNNEGDPDHSNTKPSRLVVNRSFTETIV
ncbi:hypothetical protein HELRODRAFT_191458 [Helobdella robusta]|uniref:Uncharacterized protein n=1 Tax=Helobdella robusta TaxID=6412 RepID=T1FT02_HELRO|nr:hypothetical protein HELRODRAFT_191458 [Helobdella robusta]ESO05391.1 hypothetical protein HELRODRAFT_191458 [Helobdella robusta]